MKETKYKNYYITEQGEVYSNNRNYPEGPKLLKPTIKKTGYLMVIIRHQNKNMYVNIHRLIAETLIPNPDKLPQVNHKDGNKSNNHYMNLEWVTAKENIRHAIRKGLKPSLKGSNNIKAKLTKDQVNSIRHEYSNGRAYKHLAKKYGVHVSHIGNIIRGNFWQ